MNGKHVKKIEQSKSGKYIIALIGIIEEDEIKSIVTKEMMQSVEYRIE